jgi:hypothetical protein
MYFHMALYSYVNSHVDTNVFWTHKNFIISLDKFINFYVFIKYIFNVKKTETEAIWRQCIYFNEKPSLYSTF